METFFAFLTILAIILFPVSIIAWIIQAIRKKPTKKVKVASLMILSIFILGTIGGIMSTCKHEWIDATCTAPKTCKLCGETEGELLGHNWQAATCTAPRTCSVCGASEGEPLGHSWIDATCTEPKTCNICGESEGEALGHIPGEWEIETEPTVLESGKRTRYCNRCGAAVETETYKLDSFIQNGKFIFSPKEFRNLFFDNFVELGYSGFGGASVREKEGQVVVDIRDFSYNNVGNIGFFVSNGDDLLMASSETDKNFDGMLMLLGAGEEFTANAMISLVMSCDPSLSEFEAREIASDILKEPTTKNGVHYSFYVGTEFYTMIVQVES